MLEAVRAVALLLLPWVTGYLLIGVVAGPATLVAARRAHGFRARRLDALASIPMWIPLAALLLLAEMQRAD